MKLSGPRKIAVAIVTPCLLLASNTLWATFAVKAADVEINLPDQPTDRTPEKYGGSFLDTTLEKMLARLGVVVAPEDKVFAFPDPSLGLGSQIRVYRATLVSLTDAKKSTTVRTWAKTVADFAVEQNLDLADADKTSVPRDTQLTTDSNAPESIVITRVAELDVFVNTPIAYTTQYIDTADLEKGDVQTKVAGKNGTLKTTYHVRREDGVEVLRTKTKAERVTEPVTEVVLRGTSPKLVHSGLFQDLLNRAAKKYSINATALQCMMMRESGGTPETGYPGGTYKGLFQYTDSFWSGASVQAGYAGASIYNAEAQIFTTAYELTHGQTRRWPTWPACSNK